MTDRYTRIVLTIIAVCLVIIAAKGTIDISYAARGDDVQKVEICGAGGISCMDMAAFNTFLRSPKWVR
jgi:hypothetical protein